MMRFDRCDGVGERDARELELGERRALLREIAQALRALG